jgi:predicted enzyme related to lactoylglutathione lyase
MSRHDVPMQITSSHPVLAVHDLETSGAWYRDVLGCELDDVEPGNWRFCRAGDVTFMLGRCPDAPAACELGDHSYVAYLRVDDVEAFHRRAVAAGAEVLKPPRDEAWCMRELALRSPDGHRFVLGQSIPREGGAEPPAPT